VDDMDGIDLVRRTEVVPLALMRGEEKKEGQKRKGRVKLGRNYGRTG